MVEFTEEVTTSLGLHGRFFIDCEESLQARAKHAEPLKCQLLIALYYSWRSFCPMFLKPFILVLIYLA